MFQATIERPAVKKARQPAGPQAAHTEIAQTWRGNRADLERANTELLRAQAVCWMLIHTIGTHSYEDRPMPEFIWNCVEYVAHALDRVAELIGGEIESGGDISIAVYQARGIAYSLDAVICADGVQIIGSREMMSGVIDAIDGCIAVCLEKLNEIR